MTPEEIQRLLDAFRREDDYIDTLSDEIYLAKLRVYQDTLSGLADQYGYDSEDVTVGQSVAQALSSEADDHAEKVADTYNRELERKVKVLGALGLRYEQAVEEIAQWSDERDVHRSELIAVTEAYAAHADATLAFFADNGLEGLVSFDFGGHRHDLPSSCPVCIALEAQNPHPIERVLQVGTPHPNCRQSWHPIIDESLLPDEIQLGLGEPAGIVGRDTLVQRAGSTQAAIQELETPDDA